MEGVELNITVILISLNNSDVLRHSYESLNNFFNNDNFLGVHLKILCARTHLHVRTASYFGSNAKQ